MYGYIYIRTNEYWNIYNAYKLGKTTNIPEREQTYITSEIKRGKYKLVIELDQNILDKTEKDLQLYFNSLKLDIKYNGGVEFYKKEIIDHIIPYLEKNKILYKILSEEEINNLIRKYRDNIIENKIYKPREYQKIIIDKTYNYFLNNSRGMLIVPCGVGKTLISLWITQRLNSKSILIGVPNKLLLNQWLDTSIQIFGNITNLVISGGIDVKTISNFLKNKSDKFIVITTYSSAHKILTATQELSFSFDMKILDEVHHITSTNLVEEQTTKKYIEMLKIPAKKQLALTATIKQIDKPLEYNKKIVSNDDIEYFGEIIEKKSLLWAIKNNIVCDYVIQTIITDEKKLENQMIELQIIDENDKRLFLSAYSALKSITDGDSHHILIYSNNKDNSLKIIEHIKLLLEKKYFTIKDLYYSNYHSEMKSKDQKDILNKYEKAKNGIIANVYCLGEGYDNHKIDAVVFAENMSSNIRIVQSALRASRKNKNEINKITKIILPILNKNDFLENSENLDLKKIREVIYQMSLEDETIIQKMKVINMNIKEEDKQEEILEDDQKDDKEEIKINCAIVNKLKLLTIKRQELDISYEKAKKIIAEHKIMNKEEYFKLCGKITSLSKQPEILYKDEFKNWIEYLNIEQKYYNLETCIEKVNNIIANNPDIKKDYLDLMIICKKLCEIDPLFPPYGLWIDYYRVKDLRDIISIKNNKKISGVVI
jgi:predicted helicase